MDDSELAPAASGVGLEAALGALEARLAKNERALKEAGQALRKAREAARVGNVRDLSRLLASSSETADELARSARDTSWEFPAQEFLASGGYLLDLRRALADVGVENAREVDGRLYCFPHLVRVDARDLSLRVSKKTQRRIRPSYVAGELKKAQDRPSRGNLSRLLEAIEKAYLLVARGRLGQPVPIQEVHAALTLLPGSGYSVEDFVMDLYRLDLSGPHHSRAGNRLDLPASTTARGGRGMVVVTKQGDEKVYSALNFIGPRR